MKEGLGERCSCPDSRSMVEPRSGPGAGSLTSLLSWAPSFCVPGLDNNEGWARGKAHHLLTPSCSACQMEAIGKLSDDMRRHFRMKLRNLFTKFIRKFGSVHLNGGGGETGTELRIPSAPSNFREGSLFPGHLPLGGVLWPVPLTSPTLLWPQI